MDLFMCSLRSEKTFYSYFVQTFIAYSITSPLLCEVIKHFNRILKYFEKYSQSML